MNILKYFTISYWRYRNLVKHLRRWGNGETPALKNDGVCRNIMYISNNKINGMDLCAKYADKFPEYSGSIKYPISDELDARDAYHNLLKWYDNKYGKCRRRFCLFLADEIEKENE